MSNVAPSLLAANFANLENDLKKINNANVKYLHLDVMDGNFVNNISFGANIIKAIRPLSTLIFDVHLMIANPEKYIDNFIEAGANIITFHIEAVKDEETAIKIIEKIKLNNCQAGIVIKPNTEVNDIKKVLPNCDLVLVMSVEPGFGGQTFIESSLKKVIELKEIRKNNSYTYLIEIDGGINEKTGKLAREAGCDILVAGSYLFNAPSFNDAVRSLNE